MHEDAAVAFLAAGDLPAALQSYRAGGHWRMVLALAGARRWVVPVQLLVMSRKQSPTSHGRAS